ncbi:efflux RND transporter periplasmic adaptor subunit [Paracoccus sp. 1_MG-2023]|uniref:efflux RND transporter periplasmic adaptor subunit n=1 Tax=unclassified Paracoccus (in: a-proteobacteria) TaxID=2688777 RepID=UPI001C0856E8|nr:MULTISPECIES: efflux RND transporter periplasmic adaptor subunit [unclassified Paracoccus (in: a-proteobacteria)]MBU2956851.1 efflux RND transporter periplasmic adaptor subunit [Paracoccus sp. C2R09]MDO6670236.1 efflux RND transporter periplasmic adaptor subunit [Paracoccus sp. 1_MG-2023]
MMMTAALAVAMAHGAIAQDDEAIRVRIVTAETQSLTVDLQLTGTIEAVDSIDLGFRQGGRVTEVSVSEGDRVKAGQALARVNSVQQVQALNVAEAGLTAARASEEQARQASERASAMLARGVGTRAARDQAQQALSQAEGAREQAETQVEQARRALEDTVLTAPEDAVIASKDISPGQVVAVAQPVLGLATLNGLEAVFHVADDPLLADMQDQTVRLQTLDVTRPDMTGRVIEVAPLVDPETGTVTVRVRIDDMPASTVSLLGASVRGHIDVVMDEGVVVPWAALMRQGSAPAIWTVDDEDRVALTPVEVAHFTDDAIYVSEGLADGQRVVGEGSQLLYPGRKVRPAQEVTE